jgi:hypothetical protein
VLGLKGCIKRMYYTDLIPMARGISVPIFAHISVATSNSLWTSTLTLSQQGLIFGALVGLYRWGSIGLIGRIIFWAHHRWMQLIRPSMFGRMKKKKKNPNRLQSNTRTLQWCQYEHDGMITTIPAKSCMRVEPANASCWWGVFFFLAALHWYHVLIAFFQRS